MRKRKDEPTLLHLQHEQFDKYVLKFKKYFRVWFGPFKPVLILHHPDTVKLLLKTAEPKSRGIESIYGLVFDWFGEGLLIANGKRWSRSRRLLTPAFNFDVLKHYLHIYNQCTNIMLDQISKFAENKTSFDLFPIISNCTLDIILRCVFSYETGCQREGHTKIGFGLCFRFQIQRKTDPYVEAVHDLTNIAKFRHGLNFGFIVPPQSKAKALILNKIAFYPSDFDVTLFINPLLYPTVIFKCTKYGRLFYKHCDYVHNIANDD
ncbi:hypothetical protein KUTeg_023778 [Tegillarca granosa]|uniref:Cytochrome P450 n=1 Tax=Tegillarca granosa TaxID=220873 RepID=A0ABQ9E2Q6_TEGGR|nr:hypothetical protein KUTeg_023778 [Tegillarca granosa]